MNNPLKYTDPSGYIHSHYWQKGGGDEDGIPGGGGGSFGGPGYGINGTGLNGTYYDWYSGTMRTTDTGSSVGWGYASSVYSRYTTSLPANTNLGSIHFENNNGVGGVWYRQDAYGGSGNYMVYKDSRWRFTQTNGGGYVATNSGGNWFGPYSDAVTAGGIVIAGLKPTFDAAASLAKHNPSGSVPLFLKKNIFISPNVPANNALYLGRMNGSVAIKISNTLKIAAPSLTALSVVNTGYDILQDGRLSYGDAFQAINTGLQLAFPIYGVIYGIVDVGVSMYTGGTSLTSMIKTGIDSNINASYDF